MTSTFLPTVAAAILKEQQQTDKYMDYYYLLVEPLHEELYRLQNFEFMDGLSTGQQLLISYDYVLQQVSAGGFIQFIQNGYVGLLLPMPEWLNMIAAPDMAQLIDDVLKVYVLNRELLDKQTTVAEFAALYEELTEFEILDKRFDELNIDTILKMLSYATEHIDQFLKVIG